jgi:hypothetical protein
VSYRRASLAAMELDELLAPDAPYSPPLDDFDDAFEM